VAEAAARGVQRNSRPRRFHVEMQTLSRRLCTARPNAAAATPLPD
jgi:uncharacterized MAPEG superfamily protein